MTGHIDRLENNLKHQIEVLEKIFESNKRLIDTDQAARSKAETYDDYLEEQNSYLDELDDLDLEFDEIYGFVSSHQNMLGSVRDESKIKIRNLLSEINGKSEAVRELELRSRDIVDTFLAGRKTELSETRRTTRVLSDHYRMDRYRSTADNSIFDVTN